MMDQLNVEETIVAQATARESGFPRGIIRLAGNDSLRILSKCVGEHDRKILNNTAVASLLSVEILVDDIDQPIPVQLLFWPDKKSYTRQPAAEIHAIGALPILDAIVNQLCATGARLAQPGEFTMRAFLSGRMDLTEAEAVLGVIDANDKKQLDLALDQLSGGISRPLQQARQELIHSLANLEAGLDFVEEDIEFVTNDELKAMIARCLEELVLLESQIDRREQADIQFRVVLFGQPNTGKSSLFNVLANKFGIKDGRHARTAIVSSQSGTTTDFVSATLQLDGIEIELIDTAGIDKDRLMTDESALGMGQNQSDELRSNSDLTLFCLDATQALSQWDKNTLEELNGLSIVCLNKIDQRPGDSLPLTTPAISTSALTGQGIDKLAKQINEMLVQDSQSETITGTAVRCKQSVKNAIEALKRADSLVAANLGDEFVADELRMALDAIGKITGAIYTDDILDVVFKQFCIGK